MACWKWIRWTPIYSCSCSLLVKWFSWKSVISTLFSYVCTFTFIRSNIVSNGILQKRHQTTHTHTPAFSVYEERRKTVRYKVFNLFRSIQTMLDARYPKWLERRTGKLANKRVVTFSIRIYKPIHSFLFSTTNQIINLTFVAFPFVFVELFGISCSVCSTICEWYWSGRCTQTHILRTQDQVAWKAFSLLLFAIVLSIYENAPVCSRHISISLR